MNADDNGPDQTLSPSESLDSDVVRNDDGDIVVDPPERWIPVIEDQSLEQRLAAEVPDVLSGNPLPPRPTRQHRGQVEGSPEDGESFYSVMDDDERPVN